ncbi:ABC transporter ATP-binding protein [Dissulfurispira thermophila]|uniref:ABC transporter ATP-binding protein n=2 Tax=root TaxID=1 RepID=A0A7G1GZB0_9BACT|nr:ABC transporter ATP-binding protein [Dissulfurispira thermophila]BCB95339.1 ABC transporter ATP-binding protein [Dissulfurispira thermophila]
MIEVKDIFIQTRGFSIKDASLNVHAGSCHCLIGPTGCGKTTLLEAILGLRKIQKGKILLDGKDITNLPVHERGFSYVPQDLAIFPHLTVEDNIFYGIKHGALSDKQKRHESALQIAESLGISHLLKRKAVNLSGGERQRVALARALAPGHRYILLDEPLSSLHEGMKKELWFLLKELQKKYHLTILMVSHDMEETFFLADYVDVMIDGVIHQTGTKEEVYTEPQNIEVARFFGIKNIFDAEIRVVEDKDYILYCKELNTSLLLPIDKMEERQNDSLLTIGIRAEDVIILRHDLPIKKDNLLQGTVTEIYPMGSNSMVIFKPQNSQRLIEIVMPDFAFKKLDLKPSMSVTVSLRGERLFVLK